MRDVLSRFPDAAVSGVIVWLPMLSSDDASAAAAAAATLDHPCLRHFYDAGKLSGRAIAPELGGAGRVAWDIYLVYPRGLRWEDRPPTPAAWIHQLQGSGWANAARYRTGEVLAAELHAAVRSHLQGEDFPAGGGTSTALWRS